MAKSYVEIIESYMSSVIYELDNYNRDKGKIPLSMTLDKSQNVQSEIAMEDDIKMGYLREKYGSSKKNNK